MVRPPWRIPPLMTNIFAARFSWHLSGCGLVSDVFQRLGSETFAE
jgi:hypothetical protein